MQKVLNTSYGDSILLFYKRKLAVYTAVIYENDTGNVYCFYWYESQDNRGANEIATILSKYIIKFDERRNYYNRTSSLLWLLSRSKSEQNCSCYAERDSATLQNYWIYSNKFFTYRSYLYGSRFDMRLLKTRLKILLSGLYPMVYGIPNGKTKSKAVWCWTVSLQGF